MKRRGTITIVTMVAKKSLMHTHQNIVMYTQMKSAASGTLDMIVMRLGVMITIIVSGTIAAQSVITKTTTREV